MGIDDFSHQGLPATQSPISFLRSVKVAPDGTLYIGADEEVFIVTPNGILNSLAGFRFAGVAGDGGPARAARFAGVTEMALTQTGDLLISDPNHSEVRKIAAPMPGTSLTGYAIASEDGSQLYGFDQTGRILVTRDIVTGTIIYTFSYDALGKLVAIVDAHGQMTNIERSSDGTATAMIAPTGQRTALTVGATALSVTPPGMSPIGFTFDGTGLLTQATDPTGHSIQFGFTPDGRFGRLISATGDSATLTASSTASGSSLLVRNPSGQSTTLSAQTDLAGVQQFISSSGGIPAQSTLNTDGTTTTRAADGTVTTTTPHADPVAGLQAPLQDMTIRRPSGLTVSTRTSVTATRDPIDDSFLSVIDSSVVNGNARVATFDFVAHTGRVVTAGGRTNLIDMDSQGTVTRDSVSGIAATRRVHDAAGRVTSITRGSQVWGLAYDAGGRPAAMTDALGRTSRMVYDNAGRMTARIYADLDTIAIGYNGNGAITSVTPPGRGPHLMTYNQDGLVDSYAPPATPGGTVPTRFVYGPDKRLSKTLRAGGDSITITYDSLGRRSLVSAVEGSYSYSYDSSSGTLTRTVSPGGAILTIGYDGNAITRLAASGPVNGTIDLSYNADFHPSIQRVNGGNAVAFQYDVDGLLTGVGGLTISRDPRNALLTGTTLGSISTGITYDSLAQQSATTASFGASSLLAVQFTRDALGRLTGQTETVLGQSTTYAYAYDAVGELSSVTRGGVVVATYEYDANGNRTRVTRPAGVEIGATDAQDRLVSYGGTAFAYGAAGELALRIVGVDTTKYRYGALGDLLEVDLPNGTRVEYVVDSFHRRVGRKINGSLTAGFVYSGKAPAAELDASGQVVSRFVYGTRQNVPDFMVSAGQTYRLITDHLGSVRLVVNIATGDIAQRLDYDEFGRVLQDTHPGFQPFGFAGGLYDTATGLVRFGARDYDASIGRWTSKDPLLFDSGDANLYRYVGNDPIGSTDVSGLCDTCTLAGQAMAVSIVGTMTTNQLLGRPVFQNVLRNAVITGLAVSTAAYVIPAAIEAWSLEGAAVAIGRTDATAAASGLGFITLGVPSWIFRNVIQFSPSLWYSYNFAWLHVQYVRGATLVWVSPLVGQNLWDDTYGPTIYGMEILWISFMQYTRVRPFM